MKTGRIVSPKKSRTHSVHALTNELKPLCRVFFKGDAMQEEIAADITCERCRRTLKHGDFAPLVTHSKAVFQSANRLGILNLLDPRLDSAYMGVLYADKDSRPAYNVGKVVDILARESGEKDVAWERFEEEYRPLSENPGGPVFVMVVTDDDEIGENRRGETNFDAPTPPKPSYRSHHYHTPESCPCDKERDDRCPVCYGGLTVCRVCGQAENELAPFCPGEPTK